jgi:signal transduction histidine kinase
MTGMRARLRDPDLVLALLFFVVGVVERLTSPEREGALGANVLGAVLMSAPLYWRRRAPLTAIATLAAGAGVNQAIATPYDGMFTAVLLLVVLGYTSARHHAGRERWTALGLAVLLIGGIEYVVADDPAFVCGVIAASAAGGAVVRRHVELTRSLAERTHELEALREAGERDAALGERRRIARELHDVVAHTVSIMVVQAAGARRQADRDPGRALAALDQVEATGEEALVELQRLFGLLQAGDGDVSVAGVRDLPALVDRVRAAGLDVVLDVRGAERPLAPDAALAAYRLVQEALTNTLKHAGPATARVEVRWEEDGLELVVTDTGAGGRRGPGARRGLIGMRERMELVGGQMEAGPREAGGFEVRARMPLAREEVHAA